MRRYHWPKIAGAGIVALSLTILPLALPASAQNIPDNTRDRTPITNTAPLPEGRYYDRDAVWLGAIGLLSLALLLNAYEKTES